MKGILADENLEGHVRRLVANITSSEWIDDWKTYNFGLYTFDECGLRPGMNDRTVYAYCQRVRIALVTANRNYEGPDSLEAAIRDGTAADIPVFTLADADRVLTDPVYAKELAEDCSTRWKRSSTGPKRSSAAAASTCPASRYRVDPPRTGRRRRASLSGRIWASEVE